MDEDLKPKKNLRRENPEYQEIKAHKAAYTDGMKKLFNSKPDWQVLSRAMGILNVPSLIDDRLKLQAKLRKTLV